jgi:nucleotide-binding universal stress UspA family protein
MSLLGFKSSEGIFHIGAQVDPHQRAGRWPPICFEGISRGHGMYKTILLYLPSVLAAEAVTMDAAQLALRHDARLIGAHNIIKIHVIGGIPEDVMAEHNARERRDADAIKSIFEDTAKKFGLVHEWRSRPAKDTDAYQDIVMQSRSADLIIAPGKFFNDALGAWYDLPERLVMSSGRPVLLMPRERSQQSVGKRILIAWNGSREAARAGFDALPLLRSAENVAVVSIGSSGNDQQKSSAEDFVQTLQRHGVAAELTWAARTNRSDSEELLAHVAERNCDLMVMGFYGHSRLSEMVWGGVTRHVLKAMTIPVLTSH